MSSIQENIVRIMEQLPPGVTLVAVTKTKTLEVIMEAYNAGLRDFGENRVQELLPKYEALPKDIRWHLIGHLQTNKVKYVAPFVHMIHSIDTEKLLDEVNKQAGRYNRVIPVLLQVFIAQEETKFGFSAEEVRDVLRSSSKYPHVKIAGLMGMATNTPNMQQVRSEFALLKQLLEEFRSMESGMQILSIGMSSDWQIAVEEGSTMIRVGSSIFGSR